VHGERLFGHQIEQILLLQVSHPEVFIPLFQQFGRALVLAFQRRCFLKQFGYLRFQLGCKVVCAPFYAQKKGLRVQVGHHHRHPLQVQAADRLGQQAVVGRALLVNAGDHDLVRHVAGLDEVSLARRVGG